MPKKLGKFGETKILPSFFASLFPLFRRKKQESCLITARLRRILRIRLRSGGRSSGRVASSTSRIVRIGRCGGRISRLCSSGGWGSEGWSTIAGLGRLRWLCRIRARGRIRGLRGLGTRRTIIAPRILSRRWGSRCRCRCRCGSITSWG